MSWNHLSSLPTETGCLWSSVASDSNGQTLLACSGGNFVVLYTGTEGNDVTRVNRGVYLSKDGGNTWPRVTNLDSSYLWSSVASNSYGQTLLACAIGTDSTEGGVYLSKDGGNTWPRVTNLESSYLWSSVASNYDGQTLLACAAGNFNNDIVGNDIVGGGVYLSTNGGNTWPRVTNLESSYVWTSVASNSNGQTLLACAAAISNTNIEEAGAVYLSTNGGNTWHQVFTNLESSYVWTSVASNSNGQTLLACSMSFSAFFNNESDNSIVGGVYLSTNGGNNWTQANNLEKGQLWSSVASNSDGQTLLASSFGIAFGPDNSIVGGVYLSKDGGNTWPRVTNLDSSYFWSSVASESSGRTLLAASGSLNKDQPGGVWIYKQAPCFKQDAKILTEKGYIKIQDLRPGHLVKTLSNGFKPIHSIGKRDIYHPASSERLQDQLYLCAKEHYPELFENLVITGCHSILVPQYKDDAERDKTIEVFGNTYVTEGYYRLPACVDERASVYNEGGNYTIYHFALENNDNNTNYGVYANGLLVETCSKQYLNELSGMELIE